VNGDPLVGALSELTGLLLTDFSVEELLERLCKHLEKLLGIAGASVMQIEGDQFSLAYSTSAQTSNLEGVQTAAGAGPGTAVMGDGHPVKADLLQTGDRWPEYRDEAIRAGIHHVAALPLWGRDQLWGVLNLHVEHDPLSDHDMQVARVLADAATVCILSAHDRKASESVEARLRVQLLHDPLTGLANRLLFTDRLQHALTATGRRSRSVAVFFIDLDGFKQVNDVYGHQAGDRLLTTIAGRLRGALRPSDTLARMSGDEFVVLCEDLGQHPDAPGDASDVNNDLEAVGERLLQALRSSIDVGGAKVEVRASIGAVWANDPDDAAEAIIHDADIAMYEAKRNGGDRFVTSDRSAESAVSSMMRTEADLYHAVDHLELRVVYQPIVSFSPRGPSGAEALLRWEHPQRGLLGPADFLAAAERTGLIVPIGQWVLEQACAVLSASDVARSQISVNISSAQLRRVTFAADVLRVIERAGLSPRRVILEITENSLVTGNETTTRILQQLAEAGVDIAIDDFGTGYSSFAYLKQLSATILKIDRLFVSGLGHNSKDAAIIRGITTMAHDIGLQVIAEGVETEQQRALLIEAGCDAGQGWLLGRPQQVTDVGWKV